MKDKFDTLKELQTFLGILNYARPFIKDLGKMAGPLYAKTGKTGQRHFNTEDIKLVKKTKRNDKKYTRFNLILRKRLFNH